MVASIGGADMPVVVSMLNSYSGWACSASGFMLENYLLIITGALVGSSGAILSYIMCEGMNRSFINVIAGGFGTEGGVIPAAGEGELQALRGFCTRNVAFHVRLFLTLCSVSLSEDRPVKEVNVPNVMKELLAAKSIIIVPGYGMAVARCQSALAACVQILRKGGRKVRFCIHPVAGRSVHIRCLSVAAIAVIIPLSIYRLVRLV